MIEAGEGAELVLSVVRADGSRLSLTLPAVDAATMGLAFSVGLAETKMTPDRLFGGACRLAPAGRELGLAEGVERGLSLLCRTRPWPAAALALRYG